MSGERTGRYRDEDTVYAGVVGEVMEVESANPVNYHRTAIDTAPPVTIDGKLFVPDGGGRGSTVIIVPGSLGVGPNHEMHAETLVAAGHVVFVLDPFGARAVTSTVANQTHYSFAASAFDVLATVRLLRDHPAVDPARIGAQGHSRGGAAVMTAATRRFAAPILGTDIGLAAAYAVYPWCGHQFNDPDVGDTRVRAIIGELDEWCSVQQVQGHVRAIVAAGGSATMRIVPAAHHSFDRHEEVNTLAEASVAPAAPTVFLDDAGAFIDPYLGDADPSLTDRDMFVAAMKAGHGRSGAAIGGAGDQPAVFEADMLAFHAGL